MSTLWWNLCLQTVSSYATVRLYMLDVGDNSTVNSTQLGIILDSVANDEFVIMAVQPLQAYDIWSAARSLVYLQPVCILLLLSDAFKCHHSRKGLTFKWWSPEFQYSPGLRIWSWQELRNWEYDFWFRSYVNRINWDIHIGILGQMG